jgi:peptidoglycan/LPS O-acetylase OafA/YrhL
VLSRSFARRAGDVSYCFYLVHFTVLGAMWRLLDATTATVLVVAPSGLTDGPALTPLPAVA